MRFQPGQSGNPAGRPPGSLNKKTLALEAVMAERAEAVVDSIMDRAKDGQTAAMRLCMERLVPTGRNRLVAIDLPVITTPDDAQAALAVVTAELAAGNLTLSEASALVSLVDRMLRLAERMWKFEQARLHAARREAVLFGPAADEEADPAGDPEAAQAAGSDAPQTLDEADAPLYSPVNSQSAAAAAEVAAASGRPGEPPPPNAPRADTAPPLPRAA